VKAIPVAALCAAGVMCSGAASDNLADTIRNVAASYYAKAGQVAIVTGRDSTMDYYDRLLQDAELVSESAPRDYPPDVWRRSVREESELDVSLATQLLQQAYQPMGAIRGAGETFVRSSSDGTMQPAGVYVPSSYSPAQPAALMIFLHGWLQPESRLVAPEYIQSIADRTGTIVVAPYGRGYYDFNGSASDVYDALDAATRTFAIDPRRRYLAGYSMGGFSVFDIAPMHPNDWSAVMSIAGSLLASRGPSVVATMRSARFYVLTGARDDNVPTLYPTATAIYLRDAGLPVTFYSAADGTHSLYTLRSILALAWSEMERGVVRSPTGLTGPANLPEAVH
jgi:S-formylglutathione hydrolase FrmB